MHKKKRGRIDGCASKCVYESAGKQGAHNHSQKRLQLFCSRLLWLYLPPPQISQPVCPPSQPTFEFLCTQRLHAYALTQAERRGEWSKIRRQQKCASLSKIPVQYFFNHNPSPSYSCLMVRKFFFLPVFNGSCIRHC